MPRLPPALRIRCSAFARAVAIAAAAGLAAAAVGATGTPNLPPLPRGWPATLQIGTADDPGGAAALRAAAPYGFRYQYLAGGVNTGNGWATWNPNGTFASLYVADSWAHHVVPVLTYYMLLQSKPGGGGEAQADIGNLRNAQTMSAYWRDVELLFERVRGARPVVVHVEPDLWGYLEQANDVALARAFAQRWVALRDRLAPNVILAYHMSGWGTKHDIVYEKPPDATVRAYAARSAAFYRSLHARFDVAFEDFSDRDAGFYAQQEHNPNTWFAPADFHRHLLYGETFVRLAGIRIVAWQIPLGNTVMRAMNNTWDHYQDNRVQWLLGAASRAHLRAYVAAGYAGFLFGRGADGATCACDAAHDGVTNPPPIDGNTRPSLSADDDGGYFKAQVRAYYRAGALSLPR
ncbi:MAG TPA: hypothetical protein VFA05_02435 [Gaiellaceae bacterium]|nr:hypothetical protein [Gaiellaceae bacterium]